MGVTEREGEKEHFSKLIKMCILQYFDFKSPQKEFLGEPFLFRKYTWLNNLMHISASVWAGAAAVDVNYVQCIDEFHYYLDKTSNRSYRLG